MSNKNKIEFFQKVAEMQEMNMIEDQLKEQPIFEDELSKLGYDLISKNNQLSHMIGITPVFVKIE